MSIRKKSKSVNCAQSVRCLSRAVRNELEPLERRVLLTVTTTVDHSGGFAGATDMFLNAGATINPASDPANVPANALRLTDGLGNEARSAMTFAKQGIDTFDTTFNFTFGGQAGGATHLPDADGFTFILDGGAATDVGGGGGSLGYTGINNSLNSIAVKFDLYDGAPGNALGPPITGNNTYNATGVYLNGDGPADDPRVGIGSATPIAVATGAEMSVDLKTDVNGKATGIDFHANYLTDSYRAHISSTDGKTITETVTDVTKNITVTESYALPDTIAHILGGDAAHVGFTGATGGAFSIQDITSWKYTGTAPDGTVLGATAPVDHAVTDLTAAFSGANNGVVLNWHNQSTNDETYFLYRQTGTGQFVKIATLPADVTVNDPMTFTDPNIVPGGSYSYRVDAVNSFQGFNAAASNVAGPVSIPKGGATATYYNFSFWAGAPVDSKNVLAVDYNDPTATVAGDPGKVNNTNGNSVIFTGKVHADTTGTYTFISNTGEDGWLYVNGILVSSDPGIHAQENATNLKPITLTGGKDYDFVFLQSWARYYGQDGSEGAHMLWQTPGSTAPVVVPSDHLSPTSDAPAVPSVLTVSGGPTAHNVDFTFTADNTAVVSYQLQRSADGGNTWATISVIQPGSNGAGGTPASLKISDAGPIPGASYQYRVVAVNYTGTSSPSNVFNVVFPALPSGNTPGAEAHYFNAEYWKTGSLTNDKTIGSPDEFIAMTGPVDQTFGNDATGTGPTVSPDGTPFPDIPRIHANSFSAVFTGKIKTDAAGVYTFISNSDDDGWLYLNDVLVSADPGGHGQQDADPTRGGDTVTPVTLLANTEYDFMFLFNQQAGGGSGMHIEWIEPGGAPPATVVPAATATTGGVEQISDVPHHQTVDSKGNITDVPAESAAGGLALSAGKLTWTDQSTSELWFEVQRSTDGGTTWTTVGQAPFDTGTFTDPSPVAGGVYRVRGVNWDGAGPFSNTVGGGGANDTITGTSGNDAITLKQDADGTDVDWTLNGGAVNKVAITDPKGLTINGNGGTDTITLDNSNGDPTPKLLVLNQTGAGSKFILIGLSQPSAGHKIDIENSTVQINYSGSTILPAVQTELKTAQIFSSTLASNPKFAIADDDSADPLNSGQAANTILLRPAIVGNATLNGKVGFTDFVQLARNYGKNNADWAMGDFNYDGNVGFDDLVGLARNYNQSGPAATAAALTPAVSADTGTLPKSRRPLSTRL